MQIELMERHKGIHQNVDPALTFTEVLKYNGCVSRRGKGREFVLYFPVNSEKMYPRILPPSEFEFTPVHNKQEEGTLYGWLHYEGDFYHDAEKYWVKINLSQVQ